MVEAARNRDKANTKLYFKDFDSKNTKNNLKNIYLALTNALIIIKNDDFNDLNIFEGEFQVIVEKIKIFMADKEDRLITLLDAEEKTKSLETKWDQEYQSLKYFVKAYCYKKDIDYRIFFEDLGNTTRVSHKDEESKDKKDVTEENPNNLE